MTYINNLTSYTTETTPGSAYAPKPSVVCNFGWYNAQTGAVFGLLNYTVDSNTYPPLTGGIYSNPGYVDYITAIDVEVTFDAVNSLNITTPAAGNSYPLDSCVVPSGLQIVSYYWDFGNGQSGQGPVASTVYTQPTPDGACTLTVTDNLGRVTSTTRRLNLLNLSLVTGSLGKTFAT